MRERRRDAIDRWGEAFSHGDSVEVDRIVRQSHSDSDATGEPGRIGSIAPVTASSDLDMEA